jgi:hypothetical protein
LVHFIEQDLFASLPGAEVEAGVCSFNPVTAYNLSASIELIEAGFENMVREN